VNTSFNKHLSEFMKVLKLLIITSDVSVRDSFGVLSLGFGGVR
jgi:hypothetical protein